MNTPHSHPHSIKRIIEALLFASKEPLTIAKIREVLHTVFHDDDAANDPSHNLPSAQEIRQEIEELSAEYREEERAFKIEEIANGYLLRSNEAYHPYLQILFRTKKTDRLSNAALETLAIIAYKQPITKVEIEMIRGVDCSGILHVLQERGLIEINGKLEAPGRPSLFATTKEFLKYFGINDISELPTPQLPAQAGVLGGG